MRCWCDIEFGRAFDVDRNNGLDTELAVSAAIAEAHAILPKGCWFEIRGKVTPKPADFGVAWYTSKAVHDAERDLIINGVLHEALGVPRVPVAKAPMREHGGFLLIARLRSTGAA